MTRLYGERISSSYIVKWTLYDLSLLIHLFFAKDAGSKPGMLQYELEDDAQDLALNSLKISASLFAVSPKNLMTCSSFCLSWLKMMPFWR